MLKQGCLSGVGDANKTSQLLLLSRAAQKILDQLCFLRPPPPLRPQPKEMLYRLGIV